MVELTESPSKQSGKVSTAKMLDMEFKVKQYTTKRRKIETKDS